MQTIFIIILIILAGIVLGIIFARLIYGASTFLLKRKIRNEALHEKERTFFYNSKPYDLKGGIEQELREHRGFFKRFFNINNSKGGISDYGNTKQPIPSTNNGGVGEKPIYEGDRATNNATASPTTNAREQFDSNTTQTGRSGGASNGNLFKKGKKLD
jgi:hypothetical protein